MQFFQKIFFADVVLIPLNLSMSKMSALESDLKVVFDMMPTMGSFESLILHVLYESKKKDSFFRPFLCMLPRDIPLPIFWKKDELEKVAAEINDTQILEDVKNERSVMFKYYSKFSKQYRASLAGDDYFPEISTRLFTFTKFLKQAFFFPKPFFFFLQPTFNNFRSQKNSPLSLIPLLHRKIFKKRWLLTPIETSNPARFQLHQKIFWPALTRLSR